MRKIFLSYSALINLWNRYEISHADLDSAVFMFGCTRNALMKPIPKDAVLHAQWLRHGKAAHDIMMPYYMKAEREGRAIWLRKPNGEYRVVNTQFNVMLRSLGMPEVDFGHECFPLNYPATAEMIKRFNINLDPVYYMRTEQ